MLTTEYATPYELTLTARVGADEAERNRVSLASFLPNVNVQGTTITIRKGENGLNEIAEFRAYDAETSFGKLAGAGEEATYKLPPLGQQARVSEADQLKERNNYTASAVTTAQLRVAKNLGSAVADRIELARGQVLQTGKLEVDENRFKSNLDFERAANLTITTGFDWSDPATATPIQDLSDWMELVIVESGEAPENVLMSRQVRALMKKSAEVLALAGGANGPARVVSDADLDALLAAENLPKIFQYDRKVMKRGQLIPVVDPGTVIMVPNVAAQAGMTAWGTPLEAYDAEYGIPTDEYAGIVVGAQKGFNPSGLYLNAAAIGMPVLQNANAFLSAKVTA